MLPQFDNQSLQKLKKLVKDNGKMLEGGRPGLLIKFRDGSFGFWPGKDGQVVSEKTARSGQHAVNYIFPAYVNGEDLGRKEEYKELALLARTAMGQTIRELREKAGLSQSALVTQMQLEQGEDEKAPSVTTISRLERGKNFPQFRTVEILAPALNVNFHQLWSLCSERFRKLLQEVLEGTEQTQ